MQRAGSDAAAPRRKKSAAERRAQRSRAEARVVGRLLAAFSDLSHHRGSAPTRLGRAFAAALAAGGAERPCAPEPADHRGGASATAESQGDAVDEDVDMQQGGGFVSEGGVVEGVDIQRVPPGLQSHAHNAEEVFCVRLRARARAWPSSTADSIGVFEHEECFHGIRVAPIPGLRHGRWLQVRSSRLFGTFVLGEYEDGEKVVEVLAGHGDGAEGAPARPGGWRGAPS